MSDICTEFEDGLRLHQSGEYTAAAGSYQRVIAAMPDHARAHHLLGMIARTQRQYDDDDTIRSTRIAPDVCPERAQYAHPGATRAPCRAAGFTLLETLVVLVVLSLMAGLVMSRGPARSPSLEVQAAAASLAQVLRGARATAILTGEPTRVEVDLLARIARVGNGGALALPPVVRLSFDAVSGGTPVVGRPAIAFGPDGSSSGGSFALVLQSARSVVTIDAFTGRVDVVVGVGS